MNRCLFFLFFLCATLLASCVVGPEYRPPEVDTGTGWSDPSVSSAEPKDLQTWWTRFGDPLLDQLVEQAIGQNLDVREAAARIAEARALRDATAGGYYPVVDGTASVTRRRQSENGPLPVGQFPGIETYQTIYEPGFDAIWEPDIFGKTAHAVDAADARLSQTIDLQHATRLSVAAEVARNYLALRGAQHEMAARDTSIAASRRTMELVKQQLEAGEVAAAALAQAEAQLTALEAQRPSLEAVIRSSALSLGVLLGDLPETQLGLIDQSTGFVALTPMPVGQRADILRRRPDIAAAEQSLVAATAEVGVATTGLFPGIAIAAGGGFQSLQTGNLFDSASQAWAVAPVMTWRIFDGGRVRAEIRATQARVDAAALAYERVVLSALSEAEIALTRYRFGLDALDLQADAVAAARRSYQLEQLRYRAGDTSLLDLLVAEKVLSDAQDTYARLHTGAALSLVSLFKALGGGWQSSDDEVLAAIR